MRRNPTPTITPQMYRHFAMLTVELTALLAFFANGENQEAAAAASTSEHQAKPSPAPSKLRLEMKADAGPGSWGSDDNDDFGQPMTRISANAGAWMSNPFGLSRDHRAPPGDGWRPLANEGSDDATPESASAAAAPSASQIAAAAAAAASRVRSGAHGND